MTKAEFLNSLRENLSAFPENEINDYIEYYSEMIDDRIDDGLSEEEAVADIGTPQEVTDRIIKECSIPKLIKTKLRSKHKLSTWEIVLIAVGSPIWISLLAAVFAVLISIVASVFAVIISLYASSVSVGASTFAGIAGFVTNIMAGNSPLGLALLGCGLFCAGSSILIFMGTNRLTKLLVSLTAKLVKAIKTCLIRKDEK